MGFFDSLTDLIGWTNSGAEDHADSARLNLGNIFLPGGLSGGSINESQFSQGGYGNTPLNEGDWRELNRVYGSVSDAAKFSDINWGSADSPINFRGTQFAGNNLSPEAQQFLSDNWGKLRGAKQLGDVNWQGTVGRPNYAAPTPATGGAPGAPGPASGSNSTLGDLEPARGMFAGLAASQAGEVDTNNYGNILSLLRQQAQPYENEAFQNINQNLFSRGRLGADDSTTGEAYKGFARGLGEADLGRQLSAFGLSDQLRNSALQRSLGAAGGATGLTQLSTLPFELALKLAAGRSQSALGQANSAAYQNDNILDSWSKFWSFGGKGSGSGFFGMGS